MPLKMFTMEVVRLKGPKSKMGLDIICFAETEEEAVSHVQAKYTKWELRRVKEQTVKGPLHFVMCEWKP